MISAAGIFMMARRTLLQYLRMSNEVRRQYVVPEADACIASGEPITDRSLVDDQIDVEVFPSRGGWPQVVQDAISQCRQGLLPSRSVDKDG